MRKFFTLNVTAWKIINNYEKKEEKTEEPTEIKYLSIDM